ncbi:hypothetical protein [Metallosphaera hakonensis]|uniref:hypothetical protein n=1 Tax=Metallosphaera hakonensis TaxID=79601 RepID=UPI0011B1EF04|nr:hypothetical protein [Metallosphaera hakonensis]QIJ32933.1 hypothetical protein DFR87_13140 [Metallosphaera hakonensis JCM 8857 = DSM 7519]
MRGSMWYTSTPISIPQGTVTFTSGSVRPSDVEFRPLPSGQGGAEKQEIPTTRWEASSVTVDPKIYSQK